jgi:hypothetical protein
MPYLVNKEYFHDTINDFSGGLNMAVIYPPGHRFMVKIMEDSIDFILTPPGELITITDIIQDSNRQWQVYAKWSGHRGFSNIKMLEPEDVDLSKNLRKISLQFNRPQEYEASIQLIEDGDDDFPTTLKALPSPALRDDIYELLVTGTTKVLEEQRAEAPDLVAFIDYLTTAVATLTPDMAENFYLHGYRSIHDIMTSSEVPTSVKATIGWRGHLRQKVTEPGVRLEETWRHNYPVILISPPFPEGWIKVELGHGVIILQSNPNDFAHVAKIV